MNRSLQLGTLLMAAILGSTAPASAATITAADVGTSFGVEFDAFSDDGDVSDLSAVATFTVLAYDTTADTITLSVALSSFSSDASSTARVSVLGFNTNPDVVLAESEVTGEFDTLSSGNVPNIGAVEVCASDVNCAGGGSAGANTGETVNFELLLAFADLGASVELSDFFVRYQSIETDTIDGGSGVGTGEECPAGDANCDEEPDPVPEPTTMALLGFGLLGAGFARRRR